MVKACPVISSRTRETTMLGEVPIWVISPPSSEPNAIGIRNTEGDVPERRANWKAIGIMIASAPMFLTKAESTVTTATSTSSWARGLVTFGAQRWIAASMMPDRATPALTSSALPTMMTISSLNPSNAASRGTTPTASARMRAPAATRS